MYGEVQTTEQLTPTMVRVVLGGGDLADFTSTPYSDQYINAQFIPAGAPYAPPFDTDELGDIGAEHRPRPRRYTVRRWDADRQELTIDFVAHGDEGYAGPWAQRAQPGDRLQFKGPGGGYRPDPDAAWHLLAGDESALPAIAASMEALPAGAKAAVFLVVDSPEDELELTSPGDVDLRWLHRNGSEDASALLPDAIAAMDFADGPVDVFVHGEAGEVRAVRRHLVGERGIDKDAASISPYWRRTMNDEEWRAIKRDWIADQAKDV
ncbi:MAG: siderophore-interacting protein [Actinomycetota bacterium]